MRDDHRGYDYTPRMGDLRDQADIARKEAKEEPPMCTRIGGHLPDGCCCLTNSCDEVKDDREAVARNMLDDWWELQNVVRFLDRYVPGYVNTAAYLKAKNAAENATLEILELMGVDL